MEKIREKLVDYIQDAHAMEENVLRMLDSMISNTEDQTIISRLRQHHRETERHRDLLASRLEAMGETTSLSADGTAIVGSWFKGMADWVRPDKPGKNARDAFVTEHLEIASYNLLERLAERAGDSETAALAQEIRRDEEEMARWINTQWSHVIDLTLDEAGLTARTH